MNGWIIIQQMSGGFSGGGFEYNLTTESEFEEMKQRNAQLLHENESLKLSLEDLIRVNNELTDSMEEFNNTASRHHTHSSPKLEQMKAEIQHYKSLVLTQEDRSEIVNALEGLIESFKQTQSYYEEEINSLCSQIEHYKNEWEEKLGQMEDMYMKKMRSMEGLVTEIRKKEEIVHIIERKMLQDKSSTKKLSKRYSTGLDTISEKMENRRASMSEYDGLQKEIEGLREKEKRLTAELGEKDKSISVYIDLLGNLRKKLLEKY